MTVNNAENRLVLDGEGSLTVMGNVTIRQSAYEFLLNFNRNYEDILYLYVYPSRTPTCDRQTDRQTDV